MAKALIGVLLLFLTSTASACNCSTLDSCVTCTSDTPAPCFRQCQWCIPLLSCQPTSNSTCLSSTPQINPLIGNTHSYQCQASDNADSGNGPLILDAVLTAANHSSYAVWNGSTAAINHMELAPALPTRPGPSDTWSIALNGVNWGEQVPDASARTIQLCPWVRMDQFNDPNPRVPSNPIGPVQTSCFNCTQYVDANLDPHLCGYVGDDKTKYCSSLTCQGPIYGIGKDLAVFIQVRGEPPSVVSARTSKPPVGAFGPGVQATYAHISFEAPVVNKVSVDGGATPCDICVVDPLQPIMLNATGMPLNQSVIDAYESGVDEKGNPVGAAVQVTIGGQPCAVLSCSELGVVCTVPDASGANLAIELTVGGQKVAAPSNFSYSPPNVTGVVSLNDGSQFLPSWGGKINITGEYFANITAGGCQLCAVTIVLPSGNVPCQPIVWSGTWITCTAPASGSISLQAAQVVVTTDSGSSPITAANSLTFNKCGFGALPGGVCLNSGDQVCSDNWLCEHSSQIDSTTHNLICDHQTANCTCPTDGVCQNGGVLDPATCRCGCVGGYSSSGGGVIPESRGALTAAVCDLCLTSCGGLQKQVQNSSKCGCEFNMLHLIWIILLIVLVFAAVGFGFWRWRLAQQSKGIPLLSGNNNNNKHADEEARESEPIDSASYM